MVATRPLTIPSGARHEVVFISGLTELPMLHKRRHGRPANPRDSSKIPIVVPDTIRLNYNVSADPVSHPVSQAVAEFTGANNELSSALDKFAEMMGVGNLSIAKHVGPPNDPSADKLEASLDIQYIAAVGTGNENWVWNSEGWMFEFANSLVAAPDTERPSVISVSYAWSEAQQCHNKQLHSNCTGTDDAGYIARTNAAFQKVALLGTTVLVAAGDSGAHGRTDMKCRGLKGKNMHPNYPASSPFVTSVGGTMFKGNVSTKGVTAPYCTVWTTDNICWGAGHEVVATTTDDIGGGITGGGGFSDVTSTPPFQQDAVAAYLANGTGVPSRKLFNAAGRGYPDISALAHAYMVVETEEVLETVGVPPHLHP